MSVAAAILGAGVLSASSQIFGASSAANAQTKTAQYATDAQLAMFGLTRKALEPFINTGTIASTDLRKSLPGLVKPISMTEADLVKTPGYKFTLGQGEKAVENAASARGLGVSGAAIKGGAEYATGLADRTYQQQFQNALANKQMAFNSLISTEQIGETAAAGLGTGAVQTGANVGSNIIGAGNATAASDIAFANAGTGVSNSLVQSLLAQQQLAKGGGGSGVYN